MAFPPLPETLFHSSPLLLINSTTTTEYQYPFIQHSSFIKITIMGSVEANGHPKVFINVGAKNVCLTNIFTFISFTNTITGPLLHSYPRPSCRNPMGCSTRRQPILPPQTTRSNAPQSYHRITNVPVCNPSHATTKYLTNITDTLLRMAT